MGFEGDNAAVIEAMTTRRLEETDGKSQYPTPPLHRIVTIAVAELDPDTGSFELDTLGGEAFDEKSHPTSSRAPMTRSRILSNVSPSSAPAIRMSISSRTG